MIHLSAKEQLLLLFVNSLEITRQENRSQTVIHLGFSVWGGVEKTV